jgi:hypothetical protein
MLASSFGRCVFLDFRVFIDPGFRRMIEANRVKQYHNEHVLKKYGDKLKIGTVKEEAKL